MYLWKSKTAHVEGAAAAVGTQPLGLARQEALFDASICKANGGSTARGVPLSSCSLNHG